MLFGDHSELVLFSNFLSAANNLFNIQTPDFLNKVQCKEECHSTSIFVPNDTFNIHTPDFPRLGSAFFRTLNDHSRQSHKATSTSSLVQPAASDVPDPLDNIVVTVVHLGLKDLQVAHLEAGWCKGNLKHNAQWNAGGQKHSTSWLKQIDNNLARFLNESPSSHRPEWDAPLHPPMTAKHWNYWSVICITLSWATSLKWPFLCTFRSKKLGA